MYFLFFLLSPVIIFASIFSVFSAPTITETDIISTYSSGEPGIDFISIPDDVLVPPLFPIAPVASDVPFYSQFEDISSVSWKKRACGIASLAMIIDYYASAVPADKLLSEGIEAGAYSPVGWTYAGLIKISRKYGFDGVSYDFQKLTSSAALEKLEKHLADGPVIASVHYMFDPINVIPHLVVVNEIFENQVFYNDPASKIGPGESISLSQFLKSWKKRYIVIRPV